MTFRVLTGLFGHESNAFSKLPTSLVNFENYLLAFGDDVTTKIQGAKIEGFAPEYDAISSGEYGVSRSLFVYVKKAHIGTVPGIQEFMTEYTSGKAMGEDGYLADKGLIALPEEEASKVRTTVANMTPLDPAAF